MLRIVGLLAGLLLAAPVFAEEIAEDVVEDGASVEVEEGFSRYAPDRVYLTFSARHLNIDPTNFGRASWNETNPGMIFTWADRGFFGQDYSLGVVINSYEDTSLFASVGKTWQIGDSDWRLGYVMGVADYGANARLIGSQIRSSNWIVIGGAQIEYRNMFFQLQPAGAQRGGGYGAVLVTGVTFELGK